MQCLMICPLMMCTLGNTSFCACGGSCIVRQGARGAPARAARPARPRPYTERAAFSGAIQAD